jgi:hypothetical protein
MRAAVTRPVEQLTQDTGRIATVSAVANFGQDTASMRPPLTTHNGESRLLTVSIIGTTRVNLLTDLLVTMTTCTRSGMAAMEESLSVKETAAITSTPMNDLSGYLMT